MSLENLRNAALIYFILIAIAAGLAPCVVLLVVIKGLRLLKRRGLPYVHLTQFYFRRVERMTQRASRWVVGPIIAAGGLAARAESTVGRVSRLFSRKEVS